jgi:hypothetical protein
MLGACERTPMPAELGSYKLRTEDNIKLMLKNRVWSRRSARVFFIGVGVDLEAVYDLFIFKNML